ncbi:MAG: hypothetical protein ABI859_16855 [Pseudomonadota bacterium]
MLSAERQEFETHIAVLFAGTRMFDTPELREAYWRGLCKMPLVDVVRVIEHHLSQERETKTPELPPGRFWSVARELKAKRTAAPAPLQLTPSPDHTFDAWDRIANQKLMRHVLQTTRMSRYRGDRELLAPLLEHKGIWAQEMREAAADGTLPADGDDSWWDDRMRRAEATIDIILARRQQGVAA